MKESDPTDVAPSKRESVVPLGMVPAPRRAYPYPNVSTNEGNVMVNTPELLAPGLDTMAGWLMLFVVFGHTDAHCANPQTVLEEDCSPRSDCSIDGQAVNVCSKSQPVERRECRTHRECTDPDGDETRRGCRYRNQCAHENERRRDPGCSHRVLLGMVAFAAPGALAETPVFFAHGITLGGPAAQLNVCVP